MIRSTALQGTPRRRIAIIGIPRPQRARLGSIGNGEPPNHAWTTLSDTSPDSSDNWLAYTLMKQSRKAETTPGSLTYTPAPAGPPAIVAPWNNWNVGSCGAPALAGVSLHTTAPAGSLAKLFIIGGAAAVAYIALRNR